MNFRKIVFDNFFNTHFPKVISSIDTNNRGCVFALIRVTDGISEEVKFLRQAEVLENPDLEGLPDEFYEKLEDCLNRYNPKKQFILLFDDGIVGVCFEVFDLKKLADLN
jgi:hypothetical protein